MSLTFDGPTVRALIAERGGIRTKPTSSGRYFAKPLTIDDKVKRLANGLDAAEDGTCWLWMRGIGRGGYGQITMGRQVYRTHRAAYRVAYGDIPNGLCVCHSCDVRRCINPEHLHLGTAADNHQECRDRRRNFPPPHIYGEAHPRSRLTESDVINIREMVNTHGITIAQVARSYGVNWRTIKLIQIGAAWKQLPEVSL